ncbi:tetratricopeptide repeat protein [Winogradskyella sp.]|uniref:tetratricopeptide repeat protein n=1 Tax=Winogradskyella sp. TaxID=1883156 RepID=UPI003AB16608
MQIWEDENLPDTTRSNALIKILKSNTTSANVFGELRLDSVIHNAQLLENFAVKKNLKKVRRQALNIKGVAFAEKEDYSRSIDMFFQALNISNEDYNAKASTLNNIALVYYNIEDYEKSLEYFKKSYAIKQNTYNGIDISISNCYRIINDFDKALEYSIRALHNYEKSKDTILIIRSLNQTGLNYQEIKDYSNSIIHYKKSLQLCKIIGDDYYKASTLEAIGNLYKNMNNYLQAINYWEEAQKVFSKNNLYEYEANCLTNIGASLLQLKQYSKAEEILEKASEKAEKSEKISVTANVLSVLFKLHKKNEHFEKALSVYENYVILQDSVKGINIKKELIRQDIEYNFERKKIELESENQINVIYEKNKALYILIFALSFIILTISIFTFFYVKKQKQEKVLLQEIESLKGKFLVKNVSITDEFKRLNKDKIEKEINAKLNPTDWGILNELHNNPSIKGAMLAEKVHISIDGVYSSLKKMYKLFDISRASGNQRFNLVLKAIQISNNEDK